MCDRKLGRWCVLWNSEAPGIWFTHVTAHVDVVEALDRRDAIDRFVAEHGEAPTDVIEECVFMASWDPDVSKRLVGISQRLDEAKRDLEWLRKLGTSVVMSVILCLVMLVALAAARVFGI